MEFNAKYCLQKSNENYEKQIIKERKSIIKEIKEKIANGNFRLLYRIIYSENEDWLIDKGFKLTPQPTWAVFNNDDTLIDWSNENDK